MLQFAIVDCQARRRNELALALNAVGGWQVETYATHCAFARSGHNADILLLPADSPQKPVTLNRVVYYGQSIPIRGLSAPFVTLYPLPACVEQIRALVDTTDPNFHRH